jgi:hypothetical protein
MESLSARGFPQKNSLAQQKRSFAKRAHYRNVARYHVRHPTATRMDSVSATFIFIPQSRP